MVSKRSASKLEPTEDKMASDDIPGVDNTETGRNKRIFCNTKHTPVKMSLGNCIKTKTDESEPFITGSCFLPNEQTILCDNSNKKLKIFDENCGIVRYEDTYPDPPYDVTLVDDTAFVVTMPCIQKIMHLAFKPGEKVLSTFPVSGSCYGIAVYGEDIYVSITNETFSGTQILSFVGDVKHQIQHIGRGTPDYLSLKKDGTKVYYSVNTETEAFLTCITKEGYCLFKFS